MYIQRNTEALSCSHCCSGKVYRLQLKCDGTRWRTGGEVKGKLANGVGSQYPSHCLGTYVSSITTVDAHSSPASRRLNWRPRRCKWTRPFRRKTKSGFCACAITFQLASTYFECVFVALGTQRVMRMHHTLICDYSGFPIVFPTLSHKLHDFRRKVIEHKMCVLICTTSFVRNISHSKEK